MPDYALMNQSIYEGKAKIVGEMTQAALDDGRPVAEVLNHGLIYGMNVVGEDFKHNVLYVPEVLIAARAMKAGMAILKPLLEEGGEGVEKPKVLVMGTVKGDLHDIGKNLVCMMAEGAGFEVHDIGVDQSVEKYLAAVDAHGASIVGMSALLTTTMPYMKKVIDGFEEAGKGHIKMTVGGAPISEMYAEEIGADGYGADAPSAIEMFQNLENATGLVTGAPVAEAEVVDMADVQGGETSTYKVLYWQDIPSQISVNDGVQNLNISLGEKFDERIDEVAMEKGLQGSDDYVEQFNWSEEFEREGSAKDVSEALQNELAEKFKS